MKDRRLANPDAPEPVHLVVPDKATADVLASIADNLAGIELSADCAGSATRRWAARR